MAKKINFTILVFMTLWLGVIGCGKSADEVIKSGEDQKDALISSFVISPATVDLTIGETQTFTVINSASLSVSKLAINPTWEVIGDIGKIDASGLFTATKAGSGEVAGQLNGVIKKASVSVIPTSGTLPEVSKQLVDLAISAPQGVAGYETKQSVFLSWNANKDAGLSGYKIFRSSFKDKDYIEIAKIKEIQFEDKNIQSGKEYYYKIKAIGQSDKESDFSEVCKIAAEESAHSLSVPSAIESKSGDSAVFLSWDSNSGISAKGYNVYRKTTRSASFSKINKVRVNGGNFTDTEVNNGSIYYYVVTALNDSDMESAYSEAVSGVPLPSGTQNNPPAITLNLAQKAFSPNNDGSNDKLEIGYKISDDFSSQGTDFYLEIHSVYGDKKIILKKDSVPLPFEGNFVWDGVFDNGEKAKDGVNCVIYASIYDSAFLRSFSSEVISVEISNPNLNAVISSSAFSPNGDGKFDEVSFKLRPDKRGDIFFLITKDGQDFFNKQMKANELEEVKLIWNTKGLDFYRRSQISGLWEFIESSPPAKEITDGEYVFSATAYDAAGNRGEKVSQAIIVDTTPPIVDLSSSVAKFSPNGDGKFDQVAFEMKSNEKGMLYCELMKPDNALRFSEVAYSEADKMNKATWDNYAFAIQESWDETPRVIPYYSGGLTDGAYTFSVKAVDEVGNASREKSYDVAVDLTPPKLLSFSTNPEIFSPNDDGVKDETSISCAFDEPVATIFEIREMEKLFSHENAQLSTNQSWAWNGRTNDGVAADKTYRIKVIAEDEVGNSYSSAYYDKNISVTVDTLPPVCTSYRGNNTFTQTLHAFSPNNDGKFDTAKFEFRSNEEGELHFIVTDESSNEKFSTAKFMNRDNESFNLTWNGDGLASDGLYNLSVYSIDMAGNKSETVHGKIRRDVTPPQILRFDASPTPFTPNGDGRKDTAVFSYNFSEPVNAVTKILKSNGDLYRLYEGNTVGYYNPTAQDSLALPVESGGNWEWDGRGARNELVGDTYAYYLEAEDAVGNSARSENKSIQLDRPVTLGAYLYATPDPFSPGNPINGFTEIKYSIGADNSIVTVAVEGVNTLLNREIQSAGAHSVRWYGDRDLEHPGHPPDPTRVNDASYVITLQVEHPDYAGIARMSNTVLVDSVPPFIHARPVDVDNASKKATVSYNIPEVSSVEVVVLDGNNNLIATVVPSERIQPANKTAEWIGSQTGVQYHFKITAIDRALNQAVRETESFSFE